jgi:hypothetical protein
MTADGSAVIFYARAYGGAFTPIKDRLFRLFFSFSA